jgi:hypothetical protein
MRLEILETDGFHFSCAVRRWRLERYDQKEPLPLPSATGCVWRFLIVTVSAIMVLDILHHAYLFGSLHVVLCFLRLDLHIGKGAEQSTVAVPAWVCH